MTDPNETLIVALVDRTGSMYSIRSDTEGAFNQFIDEQKNLQSDDRAFVSLYQFDTDFDSPKVVETVYERTAIDKVPKLSIEPRGGTPLNDAIGTTIVRVGEQLSALPEEQRPGKVIFVIMTDGLENASMEYSIERVKEMVTEQTEKYGWEFVFLGAGIDAIKVGGGYGFKSGQTFAVTATGAGVKEGYGMVTNSVTRMRKKA